MSILNTETLFEQQKMAQQPQPTELKSSLKSDTTQQNNVIKPPRRNIRKRPPTNPPITTSGSLIQNRLINAKRKLSLHHPMISHTPNSEFPMPNLTRRRFSNVSDAVQRKLSNWRNPQLPTEEIVTQGKSLCGQFIRSRLKRSGVFNKKLGLTRLRSIIGTATGATVRDVFPRLLTVGVELERMHPKVFVNVARQAGRAILVNDKSVHLLFVSIASQIIKNNNNNDTINQTTLMTWGKCVAIFCVAGGLAVDCVKQGRPEFLTKIVDGMEEILESDLALWVAQNGGWVINKSIFL